MSVKEAAGVYLLPTEYQYLKEIVALVQLLLVLLNLPARCAEFSVDQLLLAVKFSTQQAVNWLLIGTDPVGW